MPHNFTIGMWVRISQYGDLYEYPAFIFSVDSNGLVGITVEQNLVSSTTVPSEEWTHVAKSMQWINGFYEYRATVNNVATSSDTTVMDPLLDQNTDSRYIAKSEENNFEGFVY